MTIQLTASSNNPIYSPAAVPFTLKDAYYLKVSNKQKCISLFLLFIDWIYIIYLLNFITWIKRCRLVDIDWPRGEVFPVFVKVDGLWISSIIVINPYEVLVNFLKVLLHYIQIKIENKNSCLKTILELVLNNWW